MREKAADVAAERDGLRRQVNVLTETLRAITEPGGEAVFMNEQRFTDATSGKARMVAQLVNPTRAHGGIAMIETTYGDRRDVDVLYLDEWRARCRRLVDSGCSSVWVWAEVAASDALAAEVARRHRPAPRECNVDLYAVAVASA